MSRAIHYTIGASQPASHLFEVSCEVALPDADGQRFFLPAWIPGSYLVRDYARHVVSVSAHCGGGPVSVTKLDKSTWQCAPCAGPLTLSYDVFAYDLSVRGAYLDLIDGFFNGTNVFMAVRGREHAPVTLTVRRPEGMRDWRLATTMTPHAASEWGFGEFSATSYDEFIDHPMAMGNFEVVDYSVADTGHHVVLSGRQRCNGPRLAQDLTRICSEHVAMFGELPAMARYVFLTRVLGDGYGGLEHRSSSALICGRDELPGHEPDVSKDYGRFLGLASHEYFHLWNVKRIKPAAFTPYELGAESYTELLWVFEGITSYYDDLALARSGVIDAARYLELLGDNLALVLSVPGHQVQSLAQSSFDAWTKLYKPTANTPNAVVSYYVKGALVALALDLLIRERSADAHSLDDVMREMWRVFGACNEGVPEDGFERVCQEVTGLDLSEFFERCVRGTEPLDLAGSFRTVGIELQERADASQRVALGCKLQKVGGVVGTVFRHSSAERAGLAPGDRLVALDGLQITPKNWSRLLRHYVPGDDATLHVFRRDELLALPVTFDDRAPCKWRLKIDVNASDRQVSRRAAWLASNQRNRVV